MNIIWRLYEDYMKITWILYEYYMKIMWILKYGDNMGMLLLIIWHHTSFGASSCWPIAKNVLETMGLMSCHHAQEWKSGNEHITGLARTWYLYYYYYYIYIYTLTLRTRKIRRVALKTQGFKTKPKVFLFPQIYTNFKTMPPNALILLMRWVLKKCCISVQSTGHRRPNTSPTHNKNILYFHQFQGVPTHVYIMGAHG